MLEAIPETLLQKILPLKEILANGGSIHVRNEEDRVPSMRLRYRSVDRETGKVRQFSMALAAEDVLAVTQVIQHWRNSQRAELAKARIRLARHYDDRQRERRRKRELLQPFKANRRVHRILRDEYDQIVAGSNEAEKLEFKARLRWLRPERRRGRPPKVGYGTW